MTGRRARALFAGLLVWIAATIGSPTSARLHAAVSEPANSGTLRPALRVSPPPRTFNLIATGDVLTESAVNFAAASLAAGTGARYDFAPLFAPITSMLSSADIAICHMELPIGVPGDRAGIYGRSPFGGNLLLAPYEIAASLKRAGFDRCTTASNHSNDLGEGGIDTTLAALDAAGLSHTGTARNPAEAQTTLVTVNGVRLAHLSYTRQSNTVLPADPWRVNHAATAAQVAADVDAARVKGAEVVVVSLHLFQELLPAPLPEDRQFVTDLTARTHIDLVIEHGPHVLQPVEKVNGTWVYWSVGNFISGMGTPGRGVFADPRTLDELAASARFTEASPGVFDVEPWPVLLCNETFTRAVYAPITALADQSLSPAVRAELHDCIVRSLSVTTDLH
ncbi:MAG: CapA family protein [Ilumatobacteraceae bacterium]|nr:CapA family protein [Ilumatobacteraceae bacterium]